MMCLKCPGMKFANTMNGFQGTHSVSYGIFEVNTPLNEKNRYCNANTFF